jgi:hypothetical protein
MYFVDVMLQFQNAVMEKKAMNGPGDIKCQIAATVPKEM